MGKKSNVVTGPDSVEQLLFLQLFQSIEHQANEGGFANSESVGLTTIENCENWSARNGGYWSRKRWEKYVLDTYQLGEKYFSESQFNHAELAQIIIEALRVTKNLTDSERLIDLAY